MKKTWWRGFVSALAFHSLLQDSMGQDAFIAHVRGHWISAWYTVPVALIVLAWGLSGLARVIAKDEDDD